MTEVLLFWSSIHLSLFKVCKMRLKVKAGKYNNTRIDLSVVFVYFLVLSKKCRPIFVSVNVSRETR